MAYPPFEFLWAVKESAYGVQEVSPVAGTDSLYTRIAGANRFTPRPVPNYVTIPFGGGFAVEGYRVSDKFVISGNLQLELCYSQAQLWLDFAMTRINVGQTLPWPTTEQAGDLASMTFYHGIMRDDGTIKRRRYKGCKVHNWKLSLSNASPAAMLTLGLQAQKMDGNTIDASADPDATMFPLPADTVFPTDLMIFPHLGSTVSVGGSGLLYVEGIDISATNAMDLRFFSSSPHFATFDRLRGRSSQVDLKVLYTATPNWRTAFEAITTEATSVSATNGTHTVAITFNAKNVIDPLSDDLTPGKVFDQSFSLKNQWDPGASQDLAFTFT